MFYASRTHTNWFVLEVYEALLQGDNKITINGVEVSVPSQKNGNFYGQGVGHLKRIQHILQNVVTQYQADQSFEERKMTAII